MTAVRQFPLNELVAEAERELLRRKRVLRNRTITRRRPEKCEREINMMREIADRLREQEEAERLL